MSSSVGMESHKIHVPNQTINQIHLCVCMCMYKQWCLIVWLVLDGNHPIFLHQLGVLGVLSAGFMWLLLGHLYHLALVACSKTTHLSSSPSGWWFQPLWKTWKSMGRMTSHILWNIENDWNHQPAMASSEIYSHVWWHPSGYINATWGTNWDQEWCRDLVQQHHVGDHPPSLKLSWKAAGQNFWHRISCWYSWSSFPTRNSTVQPNPPQMDGEIYRY